MRRATSFALATAVAAGGFALLAQPASATYAVGDGKECSRSESYRITSGMSLTRVANIVGSKGSPEAGGATTTTYLFGGKPIELRENVWYSGAGCWVTVKDSTGKTTGSAQWFGRGR